MKQSRACNYTGGYTQCSFMNIPGTPHKCKQLDQQNKWNLFSISCVDSVCECKGGEGGGVKVYIFSLCHNITLQYACTHALEYQMHWSAVKCDSYLAKISPCESEPRFASILTSATHAVAHITIIGDSLSLFWTSTNIKLGHFSVRAWE